MRTVYANPMAEAPKGRKSEDRLITMYVYVEERTHMNGNVDTTQLIAKYDRMRGSLQDVGMFTRPSTIKNVQNMTGKAETFVVETCRFEELGGDFIFVECVDETGVTRLALPPKVANAISSQRDSLTKRRRSQAGRKRAAEQKAAGILPGFMRKKKESK